MIGWASPDEGAEIRLLVVDDEPHIRSALTRALNLVGYVAWEAASGEEALTVLDQAPYDLMILDMLMPGLKGIDVMQRAHQKHPELLIIVLTGHADLESAIAAVKSDAVDYLLKPASTRDIVQAVAQALQRRATRSRREKLVQLMDNALDILRQPEVRPLSPQMAEMNLARFIVSYPLRLDRHQQLVTQLEEPDHQTKLTKGEAAVMADLMMHSDQVRSCRQLARVVWGYEADRQEAESLVRPRISRLRGKLEANPREPVLILTIRRGGYLFTSSH